MGEEWVNEWTLPTFLFFHPEDHYSLFTSSIIICILQRKGRSPVFKQTCQNYVHLNECGPYTISLNRCMFQRPLLLLMVNVKGTISHISAGVPTLSFRSPFQLFYQLCVIWAAWWKETSFPNGECHFTFKGKSWVTQIRGNPKKNLQESNIKVNEVSRQRLVGRTLLVNSSILVWKFSLKQNQTLGAGSNNKSGQSALWNALSFLAQAPRLVPLPPPGW
jgi:hypothetical protein